MAALAASQTAEKHIRETLWGESGAPEGSRTPEQIGSGLTKETSPPSPGRAHRPLQVICEGVKVAGSRSPGRGKGGNGVRHGEQARREAKRWQATALR